MDSLMLMVILVGIGFFAYLLYTRQLKWLFGVVRNIAVGIFGILGLNFLLTGFGIGVGINAVTAAVVGLLGLPGVLLLYAATLLL